MSAGVYDLSIEQGASRAFTCTYQDSDGNPVDLTGYSGRGSIRLKASSPTTIADFTVTITDGAAGEVAVYLPAAALVGSTDIKGADYSAVTKATYDIELYTAGDVDVIRLLNGKCFISPEVTK